MNSTNVTHIFLTSSTVPLPYCSPDLKSVPIQYSKGLATRYRGTKPIREHTMQHFSKSRHRKRTAFCGTSLCSVYSSGWYCSNTETEGRQCRGPGLVAGGLTPLRATERTQMARMRQGRTTKGEEFPAHVLPVQTVCTPFPDSGCLQLMTAWEVQEFQQFQHL